MLRNHRPGNEADVRREDCAKVPDPEATPEGEDDFRNRHSQKSRPRQHRGVSRLFRGRRLRFCRPGDLQEKGEPAFMLSFLSKG